MLVQSNYGTGTRERNQIIGNFIVFFIPCHSGKNHLRIEKNSLEPTQSARNEAEDFRIKKTDPNRSERYKKNQLNAIGTNKRQNSKCFLFVTFNKKERNNNNGSSLNCNRFYCHD